jgi:hypothetical protein
VVARLPDFCSSPFTVGKATIELKGFEGFRAGQLEKRVIPIFPLFSSGEFIACLECPFYLAKNRLILLIGGNSPLFLRQTHETSNWHHRGDAPGVGGCGGSD